MQLNESSLRIHESLFIVLEKCLSHSTPNRKRFYKSNSWIRGKSLKNSTITKSNIRGFVVKIEMQEKPNSFIRGKNRGPRGQNLPNFKINVYLKPRPAENGYFCLNFLKNLCQPIPFPIKKLDIFQS